MQPSIKILIKRCNFISTYRPPKDNVLPRSKEDNNQDTQPLLCYWSRSGRWERKLRRKLGKIVVGAWCWLACASCKKNNVVPLWVGVSRKASTRMTTARVTMVTLVQRSVVPRRRPQCWRRPGIPIGTRAGTHKYPADHGGGAEVGQGVPPGRRGKLGSYWVGGDLPQVRLGRGVAEALCTHHWHDTLAPATWATWQQKYPNRK